MYDPLCKPFYYRGLSHAGFPDQTGVVFGSAAKNLDYPIGFLFPPDYRVQPSLPGKLGDIASVFIQVRGFSAPRRRTGLRLSGWIGRSFRRQRFLQRPGNRFGIRAAFL